MWPQHRHVSLSAMTHALYNQSYFGWLKLFTDQNDKTIDTMYFAIAEAHFLFMYFLSVGAFAYILTFSAAEIT